VDCNVIPPHDSHSTSASKFIRPILVGKHGKKRCSSLTTTCWKKEIRRKKNHNAMSRSLDLKLHCWMRATVSGGEKRLQKKEKKRNSVATNRPRHSMGKHGEMRVFIVALGGGGKRVRRRRKKVIKPTRAAERIGRRKGRENQNAAPPGFSWTQSRSAQFSRRERCEGTDEEIKKRGGRIAAGDS